MNNEMERIFIHDLRNTLTSVASGVFALKIIRRDTPKEYYEQIEEALEHARDQLSLHEASLDGTPIKRELVNTAHICAWIQRQYADCKVVMASPQTPNITFMSNGVLLRRILHNLTKNAVEASPKDVVTLSCYTGNKAVVFEVHSKTYIPNELKEHIFKSWASTKGSGRGVGLRSVFLLTSSLGGEIGFQSVEESGTTFKLTLPLHPDDSIEVGDTNVPKL